MWTCDQCAETFFRTRGGVNDEKCNHLGRRRGRPAGERE